MYMPIKRPSRSTTPPKTQVPEKPRTLSLTPHTPHPKPHTTRKQKGKTQATPRKAKLKPQEASIPGFGVKVIGGVSVGLFGCGLVLAAYLNFGSVQQEEGVSKTPNPLWGFWGLGFRVQGLGPFWGGV